MKGVSVLLFISALTAPTVWCHIQPLGFHGKCVPATWVVGDADEDADEEITATEHDEDITTSGECLKECMIRVMQASIDAHESSYDQSASVRACQWSRADNTCSAFTTLMEFGDGGLEDICFVFFESYNYNSNQ